MHLEHTAIQAEPQITRQQHTSRMQGAGAKRAMWDVWVASSARSPYEKRGQLELILVAISFLVQMSSFKKVARMPNHGDKANGQTQIEGLTLAPKTFCIYIIVHINIYIYIESVYLSIYASMNLCVYIYIYSP